MGHWAKYSKQNTTAMASVVPSRTRPTCQDWFLVIQINTLLPRLKFLAALFNMKY